MSDYQNSNKSGSVSKKRQKVQQINLQKQITNVKNSQPINNIHFS